MRAARKPPSFMPLVDGSRLSEDLHECGGIAATSRNWSPTSQGSKRKTVRRPPWRRRFPPKRFRAVLTPSCRLRPVFGSCSAMSSKQTTKSLKTPANRKPTRGFEPWTPSLRGKSDDGNEGKGVLSRPRFRCKAPLPAVPPAPIQYRACSRFRTLLVPSQRCVRCVRCGLHSTPRTRRRRGIVPGGRDMAATAGTKAGTTSAKAHGVSSHALSRPRLVPPQALGRRCE